MFLKKSEVMYKMKIIKMIKGHTLVNGKRYGMGSGCFEVEDDVAARFVKKGVAVYDNNSTASLATQALNVAGGNVENEKNLEEMSLKELKALAKEKGIDVDGNKKEDFINALENAGGNSEDDAYAEMSEEELKEVATELDINIDGLSREEIIAKCKEKEVE